MARLRSAELFPTDKDLAPQELIGRSEDVAEFIRQLENGVSLVLAGPRRTGKTSVCKAALAGLDHRRHYFAAADLFLLTGAAQLAEQLVVSATTNRSTLHKAVLSSRKLGQAALRTAQVTLKMRAMQELGQELEIAFLPSLAKRDPMRYLRYAFELLERIASKDERQLVLFIDEFQEFAAHHEPFGGVDEVTQMLASILKESPHVTCLFAGSVEHLLRDLFAEEHRAFYRFGEMVSLSPITEEEWRAGLTERFAQDGCTVTDESVRRMIEASEGHPRTTMLVAQQAHVASIAEDTREIDLSLVEVGWAEARRSDRVLNQLAVDHIKDLSTGAFVAAIEIARASSPYEALHSQEARRAIDALVRAGIVEETGRGKWRIDDPTLRDYLANLD